jgi:hypothetical protein
MTAGMVLTSLTIGCEVRGIWPIIGMVDGGQNVELEQQFKLEQSHGPALECDTQNTSPNNSVS